MPDRDAEALAARNAATLLSVRVPPGLKPRIAEAAQREGVTVAAWVTAAVEERLLRQGEEGKP